jgi:hypothetical protein
LPYEGSVFQQNSNGQAVVQIKGTYNLDLFINGSPRFTLEAKLYPRSLTDGTTQFPASPLYTIPLGSDGGGAFSGQATVNKGWYLLVIEATLWRNTSRTGPVVFRDGSTRQSMGVGEVLGSSVEQAKASFIAATQPVRGTNAEIAAKRIGPVGNSLWY